MLTNHNKGPGLARSTPNAGQCALVRRKWRAAFLAMLACCAAAGLLFARAHAGSATAEKSQSPETRFIKQYFEAFNRHDLNSLLALYAENARMIDPNYKEEVRGREKIREHISKLFESVPDIHDDVRSVVSEPGKIAVEFVSTGTPKGSANKSLSQ